MFTASISFAWLGVTDPALKLLLVLFGMLGAAVIGLVVCVLFDRLMRKFG